MNTNNMNNKDNMPNSKATDDLNDVRTNNKSTDKAQNRKADKAHHKDDIPLADKMNTRTNERVIDMTKDHPKDDKIKNQEKGSAHSSKQFDSSQAAAKKDLYRTEKLIEAPLDHAQRENNSTIKADDCKRKISEDKDVRTDINLSLIHI